MRIIQANLVAAARVTRRGFRTRRAFQEPSDGHGFGRHWGTPRIRAIAGAGFDGPRLTDLALGLDEECNPPFWGCGKADASRS